MQSISEVVAIPPVPLQLCKQSYFHIFDSIYCPRPMTCAETR